LEAVFQILEPDFADGVTDDGGGNHANHFVKKALAFEGQLDLRAEGLSLDRGDRANRLLGFFRASERKSGEVMASGEKLASLA
jgi:hypothetical protein